jgi:hypothetical protein
MRAGRCPRGRAWVTLTRLLRPPLALDRLKTLGPDLVAIALERAWSDGTTHVSMSVRTLLTRPAALVPRPRAHSTVYFGVLASRSQQRASCPPRRRARAPTMPPRQRSCGTPLASTPRAAGDAGAHEVRRRPLPCPRGEAPPLPSPRHGLHARRRGAPLRLRSAVPSPERRTRAPALSELPPPGLQLPSAERARPRERPVRGRRSALDVVRPRGKSGLRKSDTPRRRSRTPAPRRRAAVSIVGRSSIERR